MSPVEHQRLRRLVEAYVDGELEPRRAEAVRTHVRRCWECGGQVEVVLLIRAALRRHRRGQPAQLPLRRLGRLCRELAGR